MNLLWAGLGVFVLGVVVNLAGGDEFRAAALAIQLVGAALLFANAARSRRGASGREDEGEPPQRSS